MFLVKKKHFTTYLASVAADAEDQDVLDVTIVHFVHHLRDRNVLQEICHMI
jgi:hypothetical protein